MAKKGKPKKRAPGKRPQPAKRPIAAGPATPNRSAPAGRAASAGGSSGATGTGTGTGTKVSAGGPPRKPAGRPNKTTKTERIEAARRDRRRKRIQLRIGVAALAALVVGAIVVNAMSNKKELSAFRGQVEGGTCNFDTRSDPTSASPNNHVIPPSYKVNPPAGGNHDPTAASAGRYDAATAPSEPKIVHALEHGYIAIWHQPDLPKEEMDIVTKVFGAYENDVLVVPRASMPAGTKVAATAWGERLLCEKAELGPLTEFVKRYRNEGPEKVSHT